MIKLPFPSQWKPEPVLESQANEVSPTVAVPVQRRTIPYRPRRRRHGGKRLLPQPRPGSVAARFGPSELGLDYLLEKRGEPRGRE